MSKKCELTDTRRVRDALAIAALPSRLPLPAGTPRPAFAAFRLFRLHLVRFCLIRLRLIRLRLIWCDLIRLRLVRRGCQGLRTHETDRQHDNNCEKNTHNHVLRNRIKGNKRHSANFITAKFITWPQKHVPEPQKTLSRRTTSPASGPRETDWLVGR